MDQAGSDESIVDTMYNEFVAARSQADYTRVRKKARERIRSLATRHSARGRAYFALHEIVFFTYYEQKKYTMARAVLRAMVDTDRLTSSGIRILQFLFRSNQISAASAARTAEKILNNTAADGYDYTRRAYCFHLLIDICLQSGGQEKARAYFVQLFKEADGQFLFAPFYFDPAVAQGFVDRGYSFAELVQFLDQIADPGFADPFGRLKRPDIKRLKQRAVSLMPKQ